MILEKGLLPYRKASHFLRIFPMWRNVVTTHITQNAEKKERDDNAMSAITSKQIKQFGRLVSDAVENQVEELASEGKINSVNSQRIFANKDFVKSIAEFAKKKIIELACGIVGVLKLISAGEKLVIGATGGKRTIAQAKEIFKGYLDPDFKNYGCDVSGEAKPETPTEVYEMVKDADFRKIFGSFGVNLDQLCFTQDQIIGFVENFRNWLHPEGWATLFLFKVNGEFFVARVRVRSGELEVDVYRFSYDYVWDASYRYRVVVPQLELVS